MARHPGRAMACKRNRREGAMRQRTGRANPLDVHLAKLMRVAEGALKRGTPEDGREV